ncbi:MAG: hypothetical protein K8S15_10860 [Candidatus Aegiribacteria sp.]|nr:hypothetical protein [Candidatus Aegiribacteria sp.]
MNKIMILMLICGISTAGVRFGGRIGYYNGNDPRTGQSASGAVFGGQLSFPLLSLVELEVSGSYAGSESDITMEQYLVTYIENEYGQNFREDTTGLYQYLENEWGWSPDSIESQMLGGYTATFHDIDLGATMKIRIPIGALPLKPYIGAGGGAHILFSDADVLLQVINEETGGSVSIDPYDHVHPGIHGVLGVSFEPPLVPLSVFAEYKYTKPISSDKEVDGISMFYGGVNLGF